MTMRVEKPFFMRSGEKISPATNYFIGNKGFYIRYNKGKLKECECLKIIRGNICIMLN